MDTEYNQTKQVKVNTRKVSICGTKFIFLKHCEEKEKEKEKAFSCTICIFLIPLDIKAKDL